MSTRLTDEIKHHIVTRLAQYAKPAEIVSEVKLQFEVDVPRQTVSSYDFDRRVDEARLAGKKWRAVHKVIRERFLADAAEVPISNLSYRLRELQTRYDRMAAKGADMAACAVLEQAAKEMGVFRPTAGKPAEQAPPPPIEDIEDDILSIVRRGLKRKAAFEALNAGNKKGAVSA